jgi:hypothetical protein
MTLQILFKRRESADIFYIPTKRGRKTGFLGPQISFLGTQISFLGTQISFLGTQISFPVPQTSFLGTQISFLGTQISFLVPQTSFLGTQIKFLGNQKTVPPLHKSLVYNELPALRASFKRIWGPFLSALHVSRILLRTPRKGTAFGCRRFMVCGS